MKVLIYARRWTKNYYEKLINKAFDKPQIVFISDFKKCGDIWSGQFLYNNKYDQPNQAFEFEKEDIIQRCRFLRSISKQKAEELARRFWNGIEQEITNGKYDLVVSPLIDCYTMDIIGRVAEKNKVGFLTVVTSFIRNHSRFTRRGELIDAQRQVTDEEVRNALEILLKDDYKVTFSLNKEKKDSETIKFFIRRRLIDNIYFPFKKVLEGDFWNYHYNTLYFQEGRYKDYAVKNAGRYYRKLDDIMISEKSVYMPLHFSPEATVDYWCDDKKWAAYEQSIIELIKKSDMEVQFIIKEHPAMYGKRCIKFYEEISRFSNVQLVHPYENSNALLRKVNNVLVYTGSVGVEALLRGKKVFTVTDNYYSQISTNVFKVDSIKESELTDKKLEHDNESFMRKLLAGHYIGNSTAGWDIDKSDVDEMANELRRIYEYFVQKQEN